MKNKEIIFMLKKVYRLYLIFFIIYGLNSFYTTTYAQSELVDCHEQRSEIIDSSLLSLPKVTIIEGIDFHIPSRPELSSQIVDLKKLWDQSFQLNMTYNEVVSEITDPNTKLWQGIIDNKIIATVLITEGEPNWVQSMRDQDKNKIIDDSNFYYIHYVCVDSKFRKQGITQKIFTKIEDKLCTGFRKRKFLELDVRENNHAALNLYRKIGFKTKLHQVPIGHQLKRLVKFLK